MLTLHHLEYSQSFRILWLLEELGLPYELKKYDRDKKTMLAPEDYKAVSPLGTAPVITDGPVTLAETNAIVEYLLDKAEQDGGKKSPLRPVMGDPSYVKYLFWFHASQGSMMPLLLIEMLFGIMAKRAPFIMRAMVDKLAEKLGETFTGPRLKKLLAAAEADLASTKWFAGDTLSAADIVMSYCMESAKAKGHIDATRPHCQRWLDQMHASPGFQTAKEKDGRPGMVPVM